MSFNVLSLRMLEDVCEKGRVVLVVAVENEKVVVEWSWSLGPPQLITHSSIVSKLFSFPNKKMVKWLLFYELFPAIYQSQIVKLRTSSV